jgi:hypothetical protein
MDSKVGDVHVHANSKRMKLRLGVALERAQKSWIASNRIVLYSRAFHNNKTNICGHIFRWSVGSMD